MALSGREDYITIAPHAGAVIVRAGGVVVARTTSALALREGAYPPVVYIPREDVAPGALIPSERRSRCPHKGEARYFHLATPAGRIDDAVWSYDEPLPAAAAIKGHVAFYPNRIDAVETG